MNIADTQKITLSMLTRALVLVTGIFIISSCSEFIQIGPPKTEIISSSVFSDDAAATSAVRGIFSTMISDQSFTAGRLEYFTGLSSDELSDHTGDAQVQQFFVDELVSTNQNVLGVFWSPAYKYINNANAIIEGLQNASSVSSATKSSLTGEALFIRAFCHFYLVNLFGDIPYVTSTDYRINSVLTRTKTEDVYRNIIADLLQAQQLLPSDLSFSNDQRIEPNQGAASALLARVYLYRGDWQNAVISASLVISNPLYKMQVDLDSVFLANSNETILQLSPVTPEHSTPQARLFLIDIAPNYVSLTDELYSSFETGDQRKVSWTGTFNDGTADFYYPFKYKVYSSTDAPTEYSTLLRLAEQFLIRSEANAQLGNLAQSITDLDVIRARAGLDLIQDTNPGISQADLLLAIEKERRSEFFSEGHRWLDLKRTGRATSLLAPLKRGWNTAAELYPIPQSEIKLDPNLLQNASY